MQKRGLITIRTDPDDGRNHSISLTREGTRDTHDKVIVAALDRERRLLSCLSERRTGAADRPVASPARQSRRRYRPQAKAETRRIGDRQTDPLLKPGAADPFGRRIVVERRHRARAPRQHRALVDVALVGDLAAVDGSGLGQQQRARRVAGRIGRFAPSALPGPARSRRAPCRGRSPRSTSALSGRPACARQAGDVRKHQEAHLVAAMAGHDDVLRQRRQRGDAGDAQRADADPGAGIELEILGDAAVEEQSEFGRDPDRRNVTASPIR